MKKKPPALAKSLRTGLIVFIALITYAYGFQVTKVSLTEISSPKRQESLTRVLRALVRPEILEYDKVETQVTVPIYVPCPEGELPLSELDVSGAYLVVTPACSEPRGEVTVEGFNFEPNKSGPLAFIPDSDVILNLGNFETDLSGYFKINVRLPNRTDTVEQTIRAITRENVGAPKLTQTAKDTWDKIIETVFLALLATTLGVMMAVPISFVAAKNIMRDITSSTAGLALALISWPLGIWLGSKAAGWVGLQSLQLTSNAWLTLISLLISGAIIYFIIRWALPQEEIKKPTLGLRTARMGALLAAALLGVLILFLLANLMIILGKNLAGGLGSLGFLGSFVNNLGQILDLIITMIAALIGGGVLSSLLGRFERILEEKLPHSAQKGITYFLSAAAGGLLFSLVGLGINWFYQINRSIVYLWIPMAIGAILGLITAISVRKRDVLPVGLVIYNITRTILNGLRSIEALIMAIVFAVWVGIGPFAGVLALSLHTIAALGKLYSEQVESIDSGPLEAIKATGANQLQTIIYGVVPQIVPPYISFTMYRWDINVRMSTIIGFAGGGGIGFLLQQNINLLQYRAASAQMLAIAIVVSIMDYVSSYMRERVV
jgi:phosphonate ABC transporter permease subunit PhnE